MHRDLELQLQMKGEIINTDGIDSYRGMYWYRHSLYSFYRSRDHIDKLDRDEIDMDMIAIEIDTNYRLII